jgi:hypothetical protein
MTLVKSGVFNMPLIQGLDLQYISDAYAGTGEICPADPGKFLIIFCFKKSLYWISNTGFFGKLLHIYEKPVVSGEIRQFSTPECRSKKFESTQKTNNNFKTIIVNFVFLKNASKTFALWRINPNFTLAPLVHRLKTV